MFLISYYSILIDTNVRSMWLEDLDKLEKFLEAMDAEDERIHARDHTK